MTKQLSAFIFLLNFFLVQNIYAGMIRDSEIEDVIELVIAPLKKAASINDLKVYIIEDATPNAFTGGGPVIFVHSGLIINFPDPDVLRGVVAHEIGHVIGKHVARRQEVIDNYTLLAISSAAVGIAAASAAGSPGLAVMLAGSHIADRTIHSYSRVFESSADQTAIRLLAQSGHSTIGMIRFFEQARINNKVGLENPYDLTHPLSQERLVTLRNYQSKSKYSASQNSQELTYKFHRISTKLKAYTLELAKLPPCSSGGGVELEKYMNAIVCFREGKFSLALNNVNALIATHPGDPYYHELKGQILFEAENGTEALKEYDIVANTKKHDPLILLARAIIGMNEYDNKPQSLQKFYKDLLFVTNKEPDNLLAMYYLAMYYEKQGLQAKSHLNSAIIANKLGNQKEATALARAALKGLAQGSPDWYKAQDIIAIER